MTGRDVWSMIAPILAAVMVTRNEVSQDAYLITFQALKEYDERRKETQKDG